MAQLGGGLAQPAHLLGAFGAVLQVLLEHLALVVVERVERVGAGQPVQLVGHAVTPSASRILIKPSRIRVFTVPSGTLSNSATSVWV